MLENNRDEDVCRKWDDLAKQKHTCRMPESEYFHHRQNWWISLNKSGNTTEPLNQMDELAQKDFSNHMTQAEYFRYRKNWWISLNYSGKTEPRRGRSDFNQALTTWNHLHQESGEQQLRPVPFWKYQKLHQSSSSSSSWWQWSDSWWSSWKFKENPQMSLRAKRHDRTVRPVVCRLGIKPQTCDFQDFFFRKHFCCSWIVYSWRRSAATDGGCKDNTSKDPFSRCEICKNLGYRLSKQSQRQEHHWRHEAQDQHEARDQTQQCVQWLSTLGEHVSVRVVLQSSLVSLCFAVVTLIPCTSHIGSSSSSRLRLIPFHGHHHVACMSWAFSLSSSTSSSTSLSSSSSSLASSTSSFSSSSLRLSRLKACALPPRRWGLMTTTSPPQVMSPTTTSSQRLTSSSIGLRRRRDRSDAFQRVPRTSRSLWTRRPVVRSVVVVNVSR